MADGLCFSSVYAIGSSLYAGTMDDSLLSGTKV